MKSKLHRARTDGAAARNMSLSRPWGIFFTTYIRDLVLGRSKTGKMGRKIWTQIPTTIVVWSEARRTALCACHRTTNTCIKNLSLRNFFMAPMQHLWARLQHMDEQGNAINGVNHPPSNPILEARSSTATLVFQPIMRGPMQTVFVH